ncbi:MAG: nucleotidyltransferase family protein [Acidobacteriota bacterium]
MTEPKASWDTAQETTVGHEQRLLASAVDGDRQALARLAVHPEGGALARRHRLGPALALRAAHLRWSDAPPPAVDTWREELRKAAVVHLALDDALGRITTALDRIAVLWAPIKGLDLAHRVDADGRRVYARAEERRTADLDLLVERSHFESARDALRADGWRALWTGPLAERYLQDEGYAWQATGPGGVLLELHWRLWGSVGDDVADRLLARAAPAADGSTGGGQRLDLADAWLLAATHLWLEPPPRAIGRFWDLSKIADAARAAGDEGFIERVVAAAREADLQAPAVLGGRVASALWQRPECRAIAARLMPTLRSAERRLIAHPRPEELPTRRLAWARLRSGRRTRQGWRVVWRRLWPHPGLVEIGTSERLPWTLRRIYAQWRVLRPPSPTRHAVEGAPD